MAKKDDEIKDIKDKLAEKARAVGRAAQNQSFLTKRHDDIFGAGDASWQQMQKGVDDLDAEFEDESSSNEALVNQLRQKYEQGDVDVRVMQVGPDGRLTDVSDRVNPRDLRPEHIEGFQIDDGAAMPLSRNPQSREAALRLLSEILPGLKLSTQPRTTTPTSIAKMEAALAESDRILEHWKR